MRWRQRRGGGPWSARAYLSETRTLGALAGEGGAVTASYADAVDLDELLEAKPTPLEKRTGRDMALFGAEPRL